MKEAQKSFKSKNEGQIEPFTFAKNDSKQHTLLSNTNKELGTEDNNINIKISKDLNSEGITIIMISHDIATAVRYASHILHIGSTTFFGTTQEYRKSDVGNFFIAQEGGDGNAC